MSLYRNGINPAAFLEPRLAFPPLPAPTGEWGRGVRAGFASLLILLAALALHSSPSARAQATPITQTIDAPAPNECLVARPEALYFPNSVIQAAPATPAPIVTEPAPPFTPPAGDPADAETIAAITATVREALACRNAGDYLRAYALFTPEMIAQLFGGPATIDPEVIAAAVEGPRPVPSARQLGIVAISDAVILPDGRVGAIVETATARRDFRDYLFFERAPEDDRWLIDRSVPLA